MKKYSIIDIKGRAIASFDTKEKAEAHKDKLLKFALAKVKGHDKLGIPHSYRDACQEIEDMEIKEQHENS
jgi:hypothetical protein